jgi:hypothetical protein
MRALTPLLIAILLLGLPAFAGAGEAGPRRGEQPGEQGPKKKPPAELPDPELTPEKRAEVARLIKALGAEKFEEREAARKALKEIGRPALAQLRAAAKSPDLEVSSAAKKLIAAIEGKKGRSTIKIKSSGSREKGDYEVSLISSVETVTVRDFKEAFGVQIKPADNKIQLYSEPTKEAFQKKHPEIWKEYAAPLLDEKRHEEAIKGAMVRELMPQVLRQFRAAYKREPKPKELAVLRKMVRAKLEEIFKKKKTTVVEKREPAKTPAKPKSPRRENPANGPQLKPLE